MAAAGSDDVSSRSPPDFEGIHGISPSPQYPYCTTSVCGSVKRLLVYNDWWRYLSVIMQGEVGLGILSSQDGQHCAENAVRIHKVSDIY